MRAWSGELRRLLARDQVLERHWQRTARIARSVREAESVELTEKTARLKALRLAARGPRK
jgi:hypothetical protein